MISHVLRNSLISIGCGFLVEYAGIFLGEDFLHDFLKHNLVTILIALMAINATTMGVVLTKVRDMVDKKGAGGECFKETRQQMLLAMKEQVCLIILAIFFLILQSSSFVSKQNDLLVVINSFVLAVFVYGLMVLYDTAKGVLIIVDFEG
ncbi:hypothetical protein [Thalassospira sp.]|uniref:hypothetical protein n=1 Tax=Thalassospira sp. TaxID=1912094 RepID=UPI003AA8AFD8